MALLTVRLPKEMSERLHEIARGYDVSAGTIIREALSQFFLREDEAAAENLRCGDERGEGALEEIRSQFEEAVRHSSNWSDRSS